MAPLFKGQNRHAVNARDGLFACLAKLRKGLFVSGFAATDAKVLPAEITDWELRPKVGDGMKG